MQEEGEKGTAHRENCVMKERKAEVANNLAVMINHQIVYGRTEEEMESIVNDCLRYITGRAKEAQKEDKSPAEFVNLVNTIIMSLTYTMLSYQTSMIKQAAEDKGVTEGMVVDELLIEMENELQKGSRG